MKTVLITGASGGIGKELAVHFVRDGYRLVLAARDSMKLKNLKKELEKKASSTNLQKSKLFKSGIMDVKQVAGIGYKGFQSGKTVVIPGTQNKLLAASSVRFMPRKVVTSVVRNVQEREK